MAAVTTGLAIAAVGTAASIKAQQDAKKARQSAAAQAEGANIESASFLAEQGAKSLDDIMTGKSLAEAELINQNFDPGRVLRPFQEGIGGLEAAKQMIATGEFSGPAAEAIERASIQATKNPALMTGSPVVQNEIQRLAGVQSSQQAPTVIQSLLSQGRQGLAALGDVQGIARRRDEAISDIKQAAGAQGASALIGQSSQLAQLAQGAQEARILGNIAGQQGRAKNIESLANLAGQVKGTIK